MFEKIKGVIPEYFRHKASGLDISQVDALPEPIRRAVIHGTFEEAQEAMSALRSMERMRGKCMLGPAGLELINDMRVTAQQSKGQ